MSMTNQRGRLLYERRYPVELTCAELSPDGRHIAAGDLAGRIQVLDAQTGVKRYLYEAQSGSICNLAWSPDSMHLVSCDSRGRLTTWEALTGQIGLSLQTPLSDVEPEGVLGSVAWSHDGQSLAWFSYENDQDLIQILDAHMGERIAACQLKLEMALTLAWSPGRSYLASGYDTCLYLWNPSTGERVITYRMPELSRNNIPLTSIAWSADGQQVAFGNAFGVVQVCNVTQDRVVALYHKGTGPVEEISWSKAPQAVNGLIWSADGKYLATAWRSVQIRDMTTGDLVITYVDPLEGDNRYLIKRVDWSPDWRRMVSSGAYTFLDEAGRRRFEGCLYAWEIPE